MAALPFAEVLDALRARGLPIGVDDYVALGKLLARYPGSSAQEVREIIASLLARSRRDAELVRAVFDELYAAPEPAAAPPPPRPAPRPRPTIQRRRGGRGRLVALAAIGVTAAAAVAVVVALHFRSSEPVVVAPPPPVPPPGPAPPPGPSGPNAYPAAPHYGFAAACAPPPRGDAGWPPWAGMAGIWVALVGAAALVGARAYRTRSARYAKAAAADAFARLPGSRDYPASLPRDVARPFAAGRLAAAARAVGAARASARVLDVDETVRQTTRRGLFPTLVWRPPRRVGRAVVLVEAASAHGPFARRHAALCSALESEGLHVERLFFRGPLSEAGRTPSGPFERLDALAALREPVPVLVLGAVELETSASAARELARRLGALTTYVWLTPREPPAAADRRAWPRELAQRTFPLTPLGIDAAAALFEAEATGHRVPSNPSRRRRVHRNDVLRLRAYLALAARPSYALAEVLQARLLAHVPVEILAAADALVSEGARGPSAQQALKWLREVDEDGSEEARARRIVHEFVAASEPPADGSAARLRWERDAGFAASGAERAAALRRLAHTPIASELGDVAPWALRVWRRGASLGERLRWLWPAVATLLLASPAAAGSYAWASTRRGDFIFGAPIDGQTHHLADAAAVLATLCQFDGFGDAVADDASLRVAATVPSAGKVGEFPTKDVVVFWWTPVPGGFDFQAIVVLEAAIFGPDHLALGDNGLLAAGVSQNGSAQVALVRVGEDSAAPLATWQGSYRSPLLWGDALSIVRSDEEFWGPFEVDGDTKLTASGRSASDYAAVRDTERRRHSGGVVPGSVDEVVARLREWSPVSPAPRPHPVPRPSGVRPPKDPVPVDPVPVDPVPKTPCAADRDDCDGQQKNGCETDLMTDLSNCGKCGVRCPSGANAGATCERGTCGLGCKAPFEDCDKKPQNGCERRLDSATDCGKCGAQCARGMSCANGDGGARCVCAASWLDCNATMSDGCETPVSESNCGCNNKCKAGQRCWNQAGATSCEMDPNVCATREEYRACAKECGDKIDCKRQCIFRICGDSRFLKGWQPASAE